MSAESSDADIPEAFGTALCLPCFGYLQSPLECAFARVCLMYASTLNVVLKQKRNPVLGVYTFLCAFADPMPKPAPVTKGSSVRQFGRMRITAPPGQVRHCVFVCVCLRVCLGVPVPTYVCGYVCASNPEFVSRLVHAVLVTECYICFHT